MAAAAAATAASAALAVSRQDRLETPNQTVLYLALGAVVGVIYSLGTEKFLRAMQHPHIFVRNATLWLTAIAWLVAAGAVIRLATLIYNQVGGGLEGFDRVIGILIPFVVRADLVVDWAKRVAWALLNMMTWTQGSVQARRLLARGAAMEGIVTLGSGITVVPSGGNPRDDELAASEEDVWEDLNALVKVEDVMQHFEKMGRIAVYAIGGILVAVPGAVAWIVYAAYRGAMSVRNSMTRLACLYWTSLFFAPLGAVILIVASAGLLCGVVSLSVVGTVIQYFVYWSTRSVYSMVRIALSYAWAGFPGITRPHSMNVIWQVPSHADIGTHVVQEERRPGEAGAAIAQMGSLLPTELEFALASWDGYYSGDKLSSAWLSRRIAKLASFHTAKQSHSEPISAGPKDCATRHEERKDIESQSDCPNDRVTSGEIESGGGANVEESAVEQARILRHMTFRQQTSSRDSVKHNQLILILLRRLGLDLSVKSARRRRLSTYYAFGMLTHLQVESGGNAWCMHTILELSETQFEEKVQGFNCVVVEEAKIAILELMSRLRISSKYRVIPTGAPQSRMVPVRAWLQSALFSFLETPFDDDKQKQVQTAIT